MVNFTIIFLVIVGVALIVHSEIKRIVAKAEIYELSPTNDKYIKFCDIIDMQISNLRLEELKNSDEKDEFLNELANLSKVDEVIAKYLQNSDEISDNLKEKLMSEFKKLS